MIAEMPDNIIPMDYPIYVNSKHPGVYVLERTFLLLCETCYAMVL